jgi:hypothetical protein
MAVIDTASEKQRGESDSLEKTTVEERSGFHDEEYVGGDSSVAPASVPHEDDPLVCLLSVDFMMHS